MTHLDDAPDGGRRLAFAIPRRTGTAVVRNRIRRRLRAIIDDLDRDDPARIPAGSILVGAAPAAADRSSDELRHDVMRLFDQLRERRSPTP